MPFNVQEIITSISSEGILRTNQFEIYVGMPRVLLGRQIHTTSEAGGQPDGEFTPMSNYMGSILTHRADKFKLPGVNLLTSEINRYGIGTFEKRPYGAMYTDTTLSFIAERGNKIYDFWHAWINAIYAHSPGVVDGKHYPKYTVNYKDDYVAPIGCQIYDQVGDPVTYIELQRAHPVFVNDVPLDWGENNQLMRVNVGISFFTWRNLAIIDPPLPVADEDVVNEPTSQSPFP